MTKKDIELLGFYVDGRILKGGSNRIFHPETDTELRLQGLKSMKPKEFLYKIYSVAFEYGKNVGAANKIEEIKKILEIKETTCNCNKYSI